MANSSRTKTKTAKRAKSAKPYPDFPLTAHPSGRWRKIHKGTAYYFGKHDDWEAAIERYQHEWPYIIAGKPIPPRSGQPAPGVVTVADVINAYIESKRQLLDNGELSPRTFTDCIRTGKIIVKAIDRNRDIETVGPADFAALRRELARGRSLLVLGIFITRCRSVFKYATDTGMREKAVLYGQAFARPTRKAVRVERAQRPEKFFTAPECRQSIDAAPVHLRAMIMLALNAGLGNTDLGKLQLAHVDLDTQFVSSPRPKTGAPRRAALWPETVAAIQASIEHRPEPDKEAAPLLFVTKYGSGWVRRSMIEQTSATGRTEAKLSQTDAVSGEFRKLLKAEGLQADRRGFYSLRHSFRTVADSLADRPAVDLIMGHEDGRDMRGHYVASNRISDERLQAVAEHVRAWLWPMKTAKAGKGDDAK